MVVYFIKSFTEVNCTQTDCIPSLCETPDDLTDSINYMVAAISFFKPAIYLRGYQHYHKAKVVL